MAYFAEPFHVTSRRPIGSGGDYFLSSRCSVSQFSYGEVKGDVQQGIVGLAGRQQAAVQDRGAGLILSCNGWVLPLAEARAVRGALGASSKLGCFASVR